MNILIAFFGDSSANSVNHLMVHAAGLRDHAHHVAVAIASRAQFFPNASGSPVRCFHFQDALADPASLFPDGRSADILHAWTPREGVRRFCTAYLGRHPTPLVAYLEDNEEWIARRALALAGMPENAILQHAEPVIATWTPEGISHVLHYRDFVGLADAAVVIQDKLAIDVPPWVPCTTVMPGVDLDAFSPRPADSALRRRYGIADDERVIVYPGGLNDFTRPGLESLCRAVALVNRQGTPCRLLRTGPVPLDFLDRLPTEAVAKVSDLGVLARDELPPLLALADVLVQPGRHDAFEDLRLPGKLPEFLATGRPVVMPETNIAHLLRDGEDAVFLRTGTPEDIAQKCIELFADPDRARRIGAAGRRFAETHFDPRVQAARLEGVYRQAADAFDPALSRQVWGGDAQGLSVPALLARKLRLMARAGGDPMLEAQARCIEAAQAREKGLEEGMGVRDQQLAAMTKEVAALKDSVAERHGHVVALTQAVAERDLQISTLESTISWRITRPLRAVGHLARKLASAFRR